MYRAHCEGTVPQVSGVPGAGRGGQPLGHCALKGQVYWDTLPEAALAGDCEVAAQLSTGAATSG